MISLRRTLVAACLAACTVPSWAQQAEPISPALQAKVDKFKGELGKWAANPVVVKAAKASTAAGGIAGMSPAKWTELDDKSPEIQRILTSEAGKFVDSLDGADINKVVVRDKLGNVVAANTKVVLYNVTHRPVFKTAITGTPWQQETVQKDVTTQKSSVQIAVPIKDGGEIVGVMHASVSAQ
jgi:hypothetical protein